MKTKDKETNRKIDLLVKIVLIIIIILLLIHNCVLQRDKYQNNEPGEIIDIDCNNQQCKPVLKPKEIESLSFAQKNISIKKGDSIELIAIVEPSELSLSKLNWKSSNSKIVSVDSNGVIKGLKEGTAIITVTSSNGKSATCIVSVTKLAVDVKEIKLSPNNKTIKAGSNTQIKAIIEPENATNRSLVWTSSDPSIATVNSKGVIAGLKEGTVTITAKTKDGKVVATSTIKVEKAPVTPTPTPKQIESLSFAQENVSVKKGDTLGLIVTIKPSELASSKLTWTSSDSSIVSVDNDGNIKGVSVGKATITVTSSNGKKATCIVEVTTETIPVEEIILSPSKLNMDVGDSSQISVKVEPENATEREIIWTSSDPSIATVNSKGVITGLKKGTVTITAKTKDGKVVATSTITVEVPATPTPTPTPTPKQIESLSFAQENVSVKKGNTLNLIVTVKPSELASSKLTWTSSNNDIVIVDSNGVIKGLKEGTATITVTSSNGKKATCTVEVTTDTIPVEEIELTPTSITLNVGETSQIEAVVKPENATDRDIVWESSNTDAATVDSNGVVTAVGAGTTTITAKTKDGKVVSTCEVTVEIPVTPTPQPEGFNVYDDDKTPVTWNGSSDLKIFKNSLDGPIDVIAPESKNTYMFKIRNNTEYNMNYSIKFDESNDYHINMKYKLKKNDTYIVDHYVSCDDLIVVNQLINAGDEDTYYLEWYWESSANSDDDTSIGANPNANYGLEIKVEAESVNG